MKMKFTLGILASVVVLLVISCCSNAGQPRIDNQPSNVRQQVPTSETITYNWKGYGIDVDFSKEADESRWGMTIFETWDIYDQAKDENKVWGLTASKCSEEECLEMIDRSLARFHDEKPDARLDYVAIEMHIVSNLWGEVLSGLSQKLSTLNGKMKSPIFDSKKGREPLDIPDEITATIAQVLNKSQTTAAIISLMKKHGMNVSAVNIADPLAFRDSLGGQQWSKIATLPGLGIEVPGVFEFDLEKSGSQSASR
jgi:hypothetical protein